MKKTTRIFLLALAAVAAFSCGGNKSSGFDYGHITDGVYYNGYFGFRMDVPADYTVYSKEQIDMIVGAGLSMVDESSAKDAVIEAKDIQTANLLVISHGGGDAGLGDYSLNVLAENLQAIPGVSDGRGYLTAAVETMRQVGMPFEALDTAEDEVTLGGKKFYCQDFVLDVMDTIIYQRMYATVDKGFALLFTASWLEDSQITELENVLATLEFDYKK